MAPVQLPPLPDLPVMPDSVSEIVGHPLFIGMAAIGVVVLIFRLAKAAIGSFFKVAATCAVLFIAYLLFRPALAGLNLDDLTKAGGTLLGGLLMGWLLMAFVDDL